MDQKTFEALFEHSTLGILFSNLEGIIVRVNPSACQIFGYLRSELIGQTVELLIPPHLKEKHISYRRQYNQNPHPREMGSSLNLQALRKDGSPFPVEVSLTFFESEGERHIVSFVNDITTRKNAENNLKKLTEDLESKVEERTKELSLALQKLNLTNAGLEKEMEQRKKVESQIRGMLETEKELSELKSRFVSMASHEFRTPLAGILTSAVLVGKYPSSEDQAKREKHLSNIQNSVRNLTSILNDFLSIDKIDQGLLALKPSLFKLNDFLEDIVSEFKESRSSLNLISFSKSSDTLEVFQEKEMIRNIFINLLSNAIKYSPEESSIEIRTSLENTFVHLEIKDHGIGIPEHDQKNLFDRFFRAENVTNIQGTGLGLSIVKHYLTQIGGSISFESKQNTGSTFKVSFPRELK